MTEATAVDCSHLVIGAGPAGLRLASHPQEAGRYATMPVDSDGFTDQRVLILGKGNSAVETADNRLAWQSHYVSHLRAVSRVQVGGGVGLPVVRIHRDGDVVAEHRLAENLENQWDDERTHRDPLIAFLEKAVAW